jgi:hypothetical protein
MLQKWTDIATGRGKDPLEDVFPGSSFDFLGDSDATSMTLDNVLDALDTNRNAHKKKARKSDAWGL